MTVGIMMKNTNNPDNSETSSVLDNFNTELILDDQNNFENFTYVSITERTTIDISRIDGGDLITKSAASHTS